MNVIELVFWLIHAFLLLLAWAVFGTIWGFLIGCFPHVWWADRFRRILFIVIGTIFLIACVGIVVVLGVHRWTDHLFFIYSGAGPIFALIVGRLIRLQFKRRAAQ